ncbi:MAG: hypothetical protein methR_P2221 [Methyloprofundus sp.]|nr:MAG: hypothetical protein methR_P2221 [Methyloprofundus sp.]
MHPSLSLNPLSLTRSIRRLDRINGRNKIFTPISSTYVPEHAVHEEDDKISQLIHLINKLYALSDDEKLEYKKHPHKFVNTPSIVGIRHNKNSPYRVIRIERYTDYSTFSSQMAKFGFKLCIFKGHNLDGIFIKGSQF